MSGGRIRLYPNHRSEIALDQVVLAVLAVIDERQEDLNRAAAAASSDPSSGTTEDGVHEEVGR